MNGAVLIGAAVAAAIVLIAVVVRLRRRRRRDEIRSIHHYHDRLDSLHVEPHDRGGSVRMVDGVAERETGITPERPRLDPEHAHLDVWSPPPHARGRGRHDEGWAIRRMQRAARLDTGTVLVVAIVVGVLLAIALAGILVHRDHATTTTTTTTTSSSTTTTTTTTTSTTTTTTTAPVTPTTSPSSGGQGR